WISGKSAQANLILGVDLAIDGKPEQAVPRLTAALAADPANLLAKSLLADSLAGLGQPTAAENLRAELRQTHPETPECQLALALDFEKQGRVQEAVEHTRRAVEAAPEDVQSSRQLASLLMKLEQASQAIAACREGLRVAPADPELHFLLGMGLLHENPAFDS